MSDESPKLPTPITPTEGSPTTAPIVTADPIPGKFPFMRRPSIANPFGSPTPLHTTKYTPEYIPPVDSIPSPFRRKTFVDQRERVPYQNENVLDKNGNFNEDLSIRIFLIDFLSLVSLLLMLLFIDNIPRPIALFMITYNVLTFRITSQITRMADSK